MAYKRADRVAAALNRIEDSSLRARVQDPREQTQRELLLEDSISKKDRKAMLNYLARYSEHTFIREMATELLMSRRSRRRFNRELDELLAEGARDAQVSARIRAEEATLSPEQQRRLFGFLEYDDAEIREMLGIGDSQTSEPISSMFSLLRISSFGTSGKQKESVMLYNGRTANKEDAPLEIKRAIKAVKRLGMGVIGSIGVLSAGIVISSGELVFFGLTVTSVVVLFAALRIKDIVGLKKLDRN